MRNAHMLKLLNSLRRAIGKDDKSYALDISNLIAVEIIERISEERKHRATSKWRGETWDIQDTLAPKVVS